MPRKHIIIVLYCFICSTLLNADSSLLNKKNIGSGHNKKGRSGYGKISLTFDDGTHPTYTKEILDTLNLFSDALERTLRKRIVATFFTNGDKFASFESKTLDTIKNTPQSLSLFIQVA